jgi:O-antigen/teichoic acid export membrane protein
LVAQPSEPLPCSHLNATSTVTEADTPPRPLTEGAVVSAASLLWVTLAGGVTTIVLARVLGPRSWGGYAIAVSLIAILTTATSLGFEQGIAYYVGARTWGPRDAFGSAIRLAGVAGLLGVVAGVAARLLVPSAFAGLPVWLTCIAVIAVPFSLALVYTSSIALATDRYEASKSMPALQAALLLAVSIPAAVLFGRTGAVCALTIAAVISALWAIVWALRRLPQAGSTPPGQLRRAISFGIKGYGANTLQLVNYQLDLFILAAVASAAAVGQYALAVSATMLLMLMPRALSSVLYPRVARLSASGDEAAREMAETKSLRHVSLIVGLTTVGMAAALELFVVPIFGAAYQPTINLGLILLPGAAALGIATVFGATIIGRGKPNYSLYGALVTTPLTVLMYATLIPWLHSTGAAIASTVSYFCSFVLFAHFYRRVTGRKVLPLLVPSRSELADLHALTSALVSRVAHRR